MSTPRRKFGKQKYSTEQQSRLQGLKGMREIVDHVHEGIELTLGEGLSARDALAKSREAWDTELTEQENRLRRMFS